MKNLFSQVSSAMRTDSGAGLAEEPVPGSFFRRFDLFQIIPMFALLAIGALFVYGTGQQVGGIHATLIWKKQLMYMGFGLVIWTTFLFIDYRWLIPGTLIIYPVSCILLVAVLKYGTLLFGARRWLTLGGLSIQPSEFGKLAVIVTVSALLSRKNADINKLKWGVLVAIITGIPFWLIHEEPDLGTALVLLPVTGAIAFAARLKLRWILALLLMAAILAPVVYFYVFEPYQRERIHTFLNPERDPLTRNWNAIQANLAVGRGGISGKGFMQGTHCSLGYLPRTVANSDFIFPVIAEETGFLGALTLLILYGVLLFSILRTAMIAPDPFGCYLCVGIATLLITHIAVNIGMCIRLVPITGVPLPLLSSGGSFLVVMLTYLGIAQSVYAHRKTDSFLAF